MSAQALAALELGNEIRFHRARVRAEVKTWVRDQGRARLAAIIRTNDPRWRTCKLGRLLTMPVQTGPVKAAWWAKEAGLTVNRQLGQLTDRQRELLASIVEGQP